MSFSSACNRLGEGTFLSRSKGDIIIEVQQRTNWANFLECLRSRQKPRADVQVGFSHAVAGIMPATALATRRRVRFDAGKLEIV